MCPTCERAASVTGKTETRKFTREAPQKLSASEDVSCFIPAICADDKLTSASVSAKKSELCQRLNVQRLEQTLL